MSRNVKLVGHMTLVIVLALVLVLGTAVTQPVYAQGGTISYGQTVNGTVTSAAGDEWNFYGSAGDVVTISTGGSLDTVLELYDLSGNRVTYDDDGGPGLLSLIDDFQLPGSGTYTILVRGYAGSTGSYTLTLERGGGDGGGDGLDYTLSPTYGSESLSAGFMPDPYTAELVSGGGVNVRELNLGSSCRGYAANAPDYRIQWSGSSSRLRIFFVSDGDTTLIINDPYGNWHCNDDSPYGSLNPLVEFSSPSTGQYDIWVGSYSSGRYHEGTLYVTELGYHPGNLPEGSGGPGGGTIAYGQTVQGTVTSSSGNEYTFYGSSGDIITISTGGTLDTILELYDPSGNRIAYDDDGGSGLLSLIDNFQLPRSGTYTILVRGYGGSTGSYSLSLYE